MAQKSVGGGGFALSRAVAASSALRRAFHARLCHVSCVLEHADCVARLQSWALTLTLV
jgi:hypothetical protein